MSLTNIFFNIAVGISVFFALCFIAVSYTHLTVNQVVIPIKTDDHLIMVKIDDIILAEIDKNQLTIYTTDKTFIVRDTLTNFQHRINRRNFLQISRHAVMNIDHLESLSDSFSGNMMAKLTRGVKSSVSRKYVKSLMDYLGV